MGRSFDYGMLNGGAKRDFSTTQTDTFAGAKVKRKSVGLLRSK